VDLIHDKRFNLVQHCHLYLPVSCRKNMEAIKIAKFSRCGTKVELILSRRSCFQTATNIQDMTIFPPAPGRLGKW